MFIFVQVEVNEEQIRNLTIINSGKFNFDYEWQLNMNSHALTEHAFSGPTVLNRRSYYTG
jgi:hypothetical protein